MSGFTVHMLRIRCEFIFFHSGERIKKYPDWPMNSPDACGRKPYPERKSCGFKNIQIHVDEGLRRHGKLDNREKNTLWSSDWRQTRGTNICKFVNLQWQNNTWLTVKVPFLVLVSILHSIDFTFKPFKFATNILAKGVHSDTKMSQMSLIFNF